MAGDFPRRDDFEDEQEWRRAVEKWFEERLIHLPSTYEDPGRRGQDAAQAYVISSDDSSADYASSEEELAPGDAAVIIDNQERVIVQQLMESIGREQEKRRLEKELEWERKRREELQKELDAIRRSRRCHDDEAGPSRRRF